jgi:bifunctional non-homologous end joining protein LigD
MNPACRPATAPRGVTYRAASSRREPSQAKHTVASTHLPEREKDGFRAVIGVTPTDRVVRTRRGRNITDRLPELASLCDIGVDLVLDGELIAGAGRPEDFYGLAGAVVARRRLVPLTFVAFDLLHCQGSTLLDRPLHDRRRLLEHVAQLADGVLHIVPTYPGLDLDDLLDGAGPLAMEGVMLKHCAGTYRPGRRTTTWRKLKCDGWSEHRARRFLHLGGGHITR